MAIPNVQVNVDELSLAGQNILVPFIPAIILKTKTGPIGTVERVNSEAEFVAKFGKADLTTPAAFAFQKYLKLYQYAYVTRVANKNEAAKGNVTLAFGDSSSISTTASIIDPSVDLLGKTSNELVENMKILANGTVTGNFKHITDYTGFSSKPEEQEGYYFPVLLNTTGTTMTLKKNGTATKSNIPFDPELVLRTTPTDVWEIEVDGVSAGIFNFVSCNFEESPYVPAPVPSKDLLKIETKYETDLLNDKTVSLVYDATAEKIFIDLSDVMGRNITTIKEDINLGTLKAVEKDTEGNIIGGLEYILNKLVVSANAIAGIPVKVTNLFENKLETDEIPTVDQFVAGFTDKIVGGNDGNTIPASELDIKDYVDLYNFQDYPCDAMVIPEYNSAEIVNYAVTKGRENYYRVVAQAVGNTIDELKTSVQNYVQDIRGFLDIYANDVSYQDYKDENGDSIFCPVSVAVLNAYANATRQNPWCAVAGVNRGTLTQIDGLRIKMSRPDMDELYENIIPINTINYISSAGYVVWGNKTSADATKTKIFDRINVSRLINYMNRELINVGWEYLFEPITLTLFTNFKHRLEAICQEIADQDGISDYVVVCNSSNNTDETIAKNELHADVQVKPTEALEYVIINLTGTDTITINVEEMEVE